MRKKRKIDYIIKQSDDRRLIFRFYPRQSSCHSFNDKPPTKPEEIYKVYYSYAVIKQWKFNPEDQWKSDIIFYEHCDECSEIDEVGHRCLLLADGIEVFKREDGREIPLLDNRILPFGMGTDWTISKHTWTDYEEDEIYTYYTFMLFDWNDKGCKFIINEKDVKAFGEYLLGCCEYMLAHGDPI
jgi:hypothetical protein